MAYLAASYASLSLSLARTERREVIVEKEALVALVEHVVNHLLVEFCSESTCSEALSLATCEDRASVRHGQRAHLAPYRAYLLGCTAVETLALVEDAAAHCVALNVVVVAVDESVLLLELVFCQLGVCCGISLCKVGLDLVEGLFACLLVVVAGFSYGVALVVGLFSELFAQLLVVHLVAVFALHVGAEFLHELLLQHAHRAYSLLSCLEGSEQVLL